MKKLTNQVKLIIILFILIISSLLVYYITSPKKPGIFLMDQSGQVKKQNNAQASDEPFLYFAPYKSTVGKGETVEIKLKLDTNTKTVGGINIALNYDPQKLELVEPVQTGSIFNEINYEHKGGQQISINAQQEVFGQGTVAIIAFSKKSADPARVWLDEGSIIWDQKLKNNLLSTPAEFTVTSRAE